VSQALNDGRLRLVGPLGTYLTPLNAFETPDSAPADTPAILAMSSSGCVFYRPAGGGRCEIHRALGHDALPLACRQFPRVSVLDPRGVSVSLSHYCPSAAALLSANTGIEIVEDAPVFPPSGEYVGLDVRASLPPLLRPGMLMDWESWWTFERLAVGAIARAATVVEARARLHTAVEAARDWQPSDGTLLARVQRAFDTPVDSGDSSAQDSAHLCADVINAVPQELRSFCRIETASPTVDADVQRRFLAAHAFANWTAHLGEGVRTWLRSIDTAAALLDAGWSVRQADLHLRHLTDPHALARIWSRAESGA
jgi:hypothetical protein